MSHIFLPLPPSSRQKYSQKGMSMPSYCLDMRVLLASSTGSSRQFQTMTSKLLPHGGCAPAIPCSHEWKGSFWDLSEQVGGQHELIVMLPSEQGTPNLLRNSERYQVTQSWWPKTILYCGPDNYTLANWLENSSESPPCCTGKWDTQTDRRARTTQAVIP